MVPLMTQLKMETQLFICAVFMVIFLVYRLDIFTVNFIFLSFHDITSLIFLFFYLWISYYWTVVQVQKSRTRKVPFLFTMLVLEVSATISFSLVVSSTVMIVHNSVNESSGYTEIVQLLINSGNSAVLQRMLNTVEAEGETVSL